MQKRRFRFLSGEKAAIVGPGRELHGAFQLAAEIVVRAIHSLNKSEPDTPHILLYRRQFNEKRVQQSRQAHAESRRQRTGSADLRFGRFSKVPATCQAGAPVVWASDFWPLTSGPRISAFGFRPSDFCPAGQPSKIVLPTINIEEPYICHLSYIIEWPSYLNCQNSRLPNG